MQRAVLLLFFLTITNIAEASDVSCRSTFESVSVSSSPTSSSPYLIPTQDIFKTALNLSSRSEVSYATLVNSIDFYANSRVETDQMVETTNLMIRDLFTGPTSSVDGISERSEEIRSLVEEIQVRAKQLGEKRFLNWGLKARLEKVKALTEKLADLSADVEDLSAKRSSGNFEAQSTQLLDRLQQLFPRLTAKKKFYQDLHDKFVEVLSENSSAAGLEIVNISNLMEHTVSKSKELLTLMLSYEKARLSLAQWQADDVRTTQALQQLKAQDLYQTLVVHGVSQREAGEIKRRLEAAEKEDAKTRETLTKWRNRVVTTAIVAGVLGGGGDLIYQHHLSTIEKSQKQEQQSEAAYHERLNHISTDLLNMGTNMPPDLLKTFEDHRTGSLEDSKNLDDALTDYVNSRSTPLSPNEALYLLARYRFQVRSELLDPSDAFGFFNEITAPRTDGASWFLDGHLTKHLSLSSSRFALNIFRHTNFKEMTQPQRTAIEAKIGEYADLMLKQNADHSLEIWVDPPEKPNFASGSLDFYFKQALENFLK